jgi:hypothetical protein
MVNGLVRGADIFGGGMSTGGLAGFGLADADVRAYSALRPRFVHLQRA